MTEPTIFRGIVEGGRILGISTMLKNYCFVNGLKLTMDIDKSWLFETVRFEMRGEYAQLLKADNFLIQLEKEYD